MKKISIQSLVISVSVVVLMASAQAFAVDAFSRKYSDVQAQMSQVQARSPHIAQIMDVGTNDTGQMIQAIKIGTGPVAAMVVAAHHGNEYGSVEVALAMIQSLTEAPISGLTVYVVPVLNVSGYNSRTRWERGMDPNRDYPGPCTGDQPFGLKSTKAFAEFVRAKNIVTSATLHTHSPAVLYPWGFSTRDLSTEYDDLYIQLGNAATIESQYPVGNSTALLYAADGTYDDYAMLEHGIWSLLFELGFSHTPNQRAVDELIRVNVPGIRRFLEQAPRQRAERFTFTGQCDSELKALDRQDE